MVKGPSSKVIEPSLALYVESSVEMTDVLLVAVCPISSPILEECVSV